MNLLQVADTFSGIGKAPGNLLGKATGEPAYSHLGCKRAFPKTLYALEFFGSRRNNC